ncbi:MAG: SPASM domain-containing protein, partial [Candidatus Omnitrophota bacterium]|nr:SPASM domain-containing protein [Candidatus Omnitrophota bacterium]
GLAINACPLTMQDAGVTIDPQGLIYKCNSLLGYPEFSVGDVRNEDFNQKREEFLNIDAWNKCPPDCPYVPMCQGGCRLFSYLEQGNFSSLSCKREYFDCITPELMKLEYEKLISEVHR